MKPKRITLREGCAFPVTASGLGRDEDGRASVIELDQDDGKDTIIMSRHEALRLAEYIKELFGGDA